MGGRCGQETKKTLADEQHHWQLIQKLHLILEGGMEGRGASVNKDQDQITEINPLWHTQSEPLLKEEQPEEYEREIT